jgi:hypothetical protein
MSWNNLLMASRCYRYPPFLLPISLIPRQKIYKTKKKDENKKNKKKKADNGNHIPGKEFTLGGILEFSTRGKIWNTVI